MAGAGLTILRRIRAIAGPTAAVETDRSGVPRVAPATEEATALILRTASAEGWSVRLEGAGTWEPPDAPADFALTTTRLTGVTHLSPVDLVLSAQAGLTWEALRATAADEGAWVLADPPGSDRTLGGVVASGTAGALRQSAGGIRDQLLGLTLVTGDGRLVRAGGRVMKNVAGFDLVKLGVGSFGAFGLITSVTFRLHTVPRADVTLVATGSRDDLLAAGLAILTASLTPTSLEVVSPIAARGEEWLLAVRLVGGDAAVAATRDGVNGTAGIVLSELTADEAAWRWRDLSLGALSGLVTIRLGTLPSSLDDALDLVEHHLPAGWVCTTVGAGAIRWSGDAPLERLRLLRYAAAQREIPVTVERAPWAVRHALGRFGAYREGVGRLVTGLCQAFDPAGILVTAIGDRA